MSDILVLVLRLAMAIALYAFLGWALLLLWKDLQERGIALVTRRALPLELLVHQPNSSTTRRAFYQRELLIGRDPTCDISLQDETVSARHARISYHHGQWWLEDLGSTNGTQLNRLRLDTPTVLTSGDEIECGRVALVVSIGIPTDTSPTVRLSNSS